MKKKTPEQELAEHRKEIVERIERWKHLSDYGGSDPFWTDGANMELVRNHIIYYKRKISELCEENGLPLPEEYYLPLPPAVDRNYMANLKQKERVKRLQQFGDVLTTRKVKYKEEQLSLF